MDELDKFAEIFSRRLAGNRQAQLRFCVCKSVKWLADDKSMTATGLTDDVDYKDVQLGFGFIDIKPVVGSTCMIGLIEGQEALTFLLDAEQVELIAINAGRIECNGGIEKIVFGDTLKAELEKTNAVLQSLISVLSGPPVAEPGNSSPSALQAALKASVSGKQLGDFSEILDDKITH